MAELTGDAMSLLTAQNLLNYEFVGTAYTPPVNWYLGLYNTAPTDGGGGVEASGGGYARIEIPRNSTNFAATDASGRCYLQVEKTFGVLTGNIGSIVAVGWFSASTGDTLRYWTAISARTYNAGQEPSFAANTLYIQFS